MKKNDVKEFLKEHNIKPTLIRVKTLEYLWSTREHPDAEKIFFEVAKSIPTLSMTSIYNTLNLFVEKKIIQEIKIEGVQIRYDGTVDKHGHFKCIKCGKLLDVEMDKEYKLNIKEGKIIQEHIYLLGICNECLKKENL